MTGDRRQSQSDNRKRFLNTKMKNVIFIITSLLFSIIYFFVEIYLLYLCHEYISFIWNYLALFSFILFPIIYYFIILKFKRRFNNKYKTEMSLSTFMISLIVGGFFIFQAPMAIPTLSSAIEKAKIGQNSKKLYDLKNNIEQYINKNNKLPVNFNEINYNISIDKLSYNISKFNFEKIYSNELSIIKDSGNNIYSLEVDMKYNYLIYDSRIDKIIQIYKGEPMNNYKINYVSK